MAVYFDTSALAKRYVPESGSDALDTFVSGQDEPGVITALVAVELESVLQRLTRQRLIDAAFADLARRRYAADLTAVVWRIQPFLPESFARAESLVRDLGTPINTLDALHLASAMNLHCTSIATGDRQLARAAAACNLAVHTFV